MSELATIRAQFDAAVGDSSDLVIFFDPHGTIRHASGACRSLPGIEASELVGRNALDLIHRDDQERMFAEFTSIPNLGDHVRAEFRIEDTRGNVLWLEQIATNFLDDPDCGYIVANLRDITDRVLAEEAIRQLSAIVECSRDAIFSSSCTGVITTWNAGAAGLFGYTGAEMIGCDVNDLFPIDGDEDVRHVFDEALHGAAVDNVGTRGHHADGTSVSVSISVSPIRSRSGEISGTSTIVRDETERDELLQRIEGVHRRLAEAQASAKLGSFEVDLVTGTVTRSDELCRILGLRPGSSSGMGLDSVHPDDRDRARELVGEAAAGRHNAEIALLHRATYDSLTEVLNRASLHDRLRSALSVPDTGHVVALAVIDIDGFKLLNEVAGHSIGDHSLQALAQRLLAGLRTTDLVARVGGDEFAVVRLDARCLDDAERLGMDVMNLLEAPLVLPDREVVLRYSIGVTLSTKTDTPEALLRDAEDAMYQAKREGGSQAIVFDHQARTRAQRRQSVAVALPHALEHDELHLQYQPIVSLATRVVAGFESLLRWKHPHLGTISPDEFIPIAETTGQILPIGAWALDHALHQLAAWRCDPLLPPNLWMAINVSAQQLAQPHLVDHISAAIDRAGVPASAVHLEITESVLMDRVDKALHTIVEMKSAGFSVSIDDFGTGYSSLSYLSRLPVDTMKIDRSFVGGLDRGDGNDMSIVRAIMALALALNLDVVAEGVETASQFRLLTELGCTHGQGFLWSRPLDATAARGWMLDRAYAADLRRLVP